MLKRLLSRLSAPVLIAVLLCPAALAQEPGVSLATVVRYALTNYPAILAAGANAQAARYGIDQAQAAHYPSVSMNAQRRIEGPAFNLLQPQMNLNIYASGAIEATVDREKWRARSLETTQASTSEDVAFTAALAWYRLLRAQRVQAANLRNRDRHEKLVEDFEAITRFDRGRAYDLIQARSRLEQVRQLCAAGDAELLAARQALRRYYPGADESPRSPAPPLPFPPELQGPAPTLSSEQLIEDHPSVVALREAVSSAQANVQAARRSRGPRIDLAASAGAHASTVVTMSWPAFDMARSAAEDIAVAQLSSAQFSLDEQRLVVRDRQLAANALWTTAEDRIRVARQQVDASSQLVDVYREQFRIGRRNLLDLLNAFAELYSAESSLANAEVDRSQGRYQIEYAAGHFGRIFERGQVPG